jgi:hypothetical protein
MRILISFLTLLFSFSASAAVQTTVDINQLSDSDLIATAEKLYTGDNFMISYVLIKKAEEKGSNDPRIAFYIKLLRPLIAGKGFNTRAALVAGDYLKKTAHRSSLIPMHYVEDRDNIDAFINSKDVPVARNETEFQDYLDKVFNEFEITRQYLRTFNGPITVTWPASKVGGKTRGKTCDAKLEGTTLTYRHCETSLGTFQLNNADAQVLAQNYSLIEFHLMLATAYNVTGLTTLTAVPDVLLSDRELIEFVKSNRDFGLLRAQNKLRYFRNMAEDFEHVVTTFVAEEKDVCASKALNMRKGVCVQIAGDEGLAPIMDQFFTRVVPAIVHAQPIPSLENNSKALIYPAKFFYTPITNLRDYMPTKFDSCGRAIEFPDVSFNGISMEPYDQKNLIRGRQKTPCH